MSGIIGGAGSKSGVIGTTELDYEEGSWTPAINLASIAYTSRTGRYIRVGNLCWLWIHINLSSHSSTTSTNNWLISGLPFSYTSTNSEMSFGVFDNNGGAYIGAGRAENSTSLLFRAAVSGTANLHMGICLNLS
jgi:hypothetical protein